MGQIETRGVSSCMCIQNALSVLDANPETCEARAHPERVCVQCVQQHLSQGKLEASLHLFCWRKTNWLKKVLKELTLTTAAV